jgi:cbb3-type cytochrome oxidase subunit 1
MFELPVAWYLMRRVEKIAKRKGRKSGWYKVLAWVLLFGGELFGLIVGTATGTDYWPIVYPLYAWLGAVAGAGVVLLIVNSLEIKVHPSETNPDYVICPNCGLQQWKGGYEKCKKCDTQLR